MHDMVKNYLANQRQGTQSALTRAEVSGGGKNHGDKKVQVMLDKVLQELLNGHMAVLYLLQSHAATDILLNKKVRRLAMKSALSSKVLDNELVVLDKIAMDEYKTKTIAAMLKAVGSEKKALIVLPEKNEKVIASAANIPGVKTALVNTLNVYDIFECRQIYRASRCNCTN